MNKVPPTKTLLVSGFDFPPQRGGISRFMAAAASCLGPHQVCCLTGVATKGQTSDAVAEASDLKVYRRPMAFSAQRIIQPIPFGASILEIMVRERPTVVQLASADEGYIGLWLNKWFKLPFVVYAHGNEVLRAINSTWPKPRMSLMKAAVVLAVSNFTAQLVMKAGVAKAKIEVLHPGCDIDRFHPHEAKLEVRQGILKERWNDKIILSVGRIVARKGHDMVVGALPRLLKSHPKLTYLIVGEGPNRPEIEALALRTGVRENVTFAENVPDDVLPDVYAMSDIFIMPSRQQLESCDVEGFGMVYLEANATGKPVVAGRSGGTSDAVLDGLTGIMVDPLDQEEIARALGQLLDSPETAARLGTAGRARVEREFTWPRFGERLREILARVAEEARHGDRGRTT